MSTLRISENPTNRVELEDLSENSVISEKNSLSESAVATAEKIAELKAGLQNLSLHQYAESDEVCDKISFQVKKYKHLIRQLNRRELVGVQKCIEELIQRTKLRTAAKNQLIDQLKLPIEKKSLRCQMANAHDEGVLRAVELVTVPKKKQNAAVNKFLKTAARMNEKKNLLVEKGWREVHQLTLIDPIIREFNHHSGKELVSDKVLEHCYSLAPHAERIYRAKELELTKKLREFQGSLFERIVSGSPGSEKQIQGVKSQLDTITERRMACQKLLPESQSKNISWNIPLLAIGSLAILTLFAASQLNRGKAMN